MIKKNLLPKQQANYQAMMSECFVDLTKPMIKPPIALSVGDYSYAGSLQPTPFGTYGNFSCIVGPSKSMKTVLKSAITACYIGGKSNNYFPNVKGFDTEEKYVVDFDSEQSDFHVHMSANRVREMVGALPDRYIPLSFRSKSPRERLGFLEWLFMESEYRKHLGLVSVDGACI